jgi:hypothetical protein
MIGGYLAGLVQQEKFKNTEYDVNYGGLAYSLNKIKNKLHVIEDDLGKRGIPSVLLQQRDTIISLFQKIMLDRIATARRNLHYCKPSAENSKYLLVWLLGKTNHGCLSIRELSCIVYKSGNVN